MQLPVLKLPISGVESPTDARRSAIAADLAKLARGQVRFGRHDRMLYATDASLYQVEPLGVVVPADINDAQAVVEYCFEHKLPILPRGGGTSLAGQCTAEAIVLDCSAFLRGIRDLNTADRSVYAEAGVALDELNNELARRGAGLFFAPDPATTAQATIGGCIGNNAAGSRSVKFGRTVDSILAIDTILSSGARVRFAPAAGRENAIALKLADRVIEITRAHEALIRERFPKTLRRNAGLALDLILAQLDAGADAHTLNLAPLLCGSEGTLAITTGALCKLFPTPRGKGLALLSFPSVDAAIDLVPTILQTGPSAVELVDDVVIEAALGNIECARYVEAFPRLASGDLPGAVLYVEYQEPAPADVESRFDRLRSLIAAAPARFLSDPGQMADAWKLRKAGEPLLHSLPGARKPLTFVEDNAVPVENLGRFVREFRKIVQREGTRAAFWAHASVGVLHVRPLLDPHNQADKDALIRIAVEVADLARACGGIMSGEHGDGKVRGPLIERFFGPELLSAFRQVKAAFDPAGILNPGNIVNPGPVASILQRTRMEPSARQHASGHTDPNARPHAPSTQTYFNYDRDEGFAHAVERCNGAGVCRKQSGGTMCPSYRATMDERHSTRGRGNALRLAITGQLADANATDTDRYADPQTIATLDLCLSCKACKSECPSNVDISKLKAEYTAQRYRAQGRVPISELLVGHVRTLNRIGSLTPGLANFVNSLPPMRALINRVMHMHPARSMPKFSTSLYRRARTLKRHDDAAATAASTSRVAMFADCFTTYNESDLGIAALRLLSRLGWDVDLPRTGCCGRSMISVGMLEQAIETADATIAALRPAILDPNIDAILFVEPSCLSAVKDDWLELNCKSPLDLRKDLAAKAMLVEEFIESRWTRHPNQSTVKALSAAGSDGPSILLHAHCHQKALWGAESSARILRRIAARRLTVLNTGCCGMAGSFGYDADKFDLSIRIAHLSGQNGEPGGGVMPLISTHRAANADAIVLATGTSCRHQIKDASSPATQHALHPVQWLNSLIEDGAE